MNERYAWALGVMFGGMLLVLVVGEFLGFSTHPVRFLKRAIMQLCMSAMILLSCGIIAWPFSNLVRSIGIALIAAVAFSWFQTRWLDRKLHGTTFLMKPEFSRKMFIGVVGWIISRETFEYFFPKNPIFEFKNWLPVFVGLFLSSVFWIGWILRLERKLGAPIVEQIKTSE